MLWQRRRNQSGHKFEARSIILEGNSKLKQDPLRNQEYSMNHWRLESILINKKDSFAHPQFGTQTRKENEGRVKQDVQIWSILQEDIKRQSRQLHSENDA